RRAPLPRALTGADATPLARPVPCRSDGSQQPRSPDKRSASGIPVGWAMACPGCGLRPYPGYSSAGVDAVSGAGEGGDRHYHPFNPVGEGEASSPVGFVARISEAHPGSPWAGPWPVPDAAFGLIRVTHLLVSTRSVARARGPTVTTIAFTGGRGGDTQPRRPGSPDK